MYILPYMHIQPHMAYYVYAKKSVTQTHFRHADYYLMLEMEKTVESGHPAGVPQTSLYGTATDRESLLLGKKTSGGDVVEAVEGWEVGIGAEADDMVADNVYM